MQNEVQVYKPKTVYEVQTKDIYENFEVLRRNQRRTAHKFEKKNLEEEMQKVLHEQYRYLSGLDYNVIVQSCEEFNPKPRTTQVIIHDEVRNPRDEEDIVKIVKNEQHNAHAIPDLPKETFTRQKRPSSTSTMRTRQEGKVTIISTNERSRVPENSYQVQNDDRFMYTESIRDGFRDKIRSAFNIITEKRDFTSIPALNLDPNRSTRRAPAVEETEPQEEFVVNEAPKSNRSSSSAASRRTTQKKTHEPVLYTNRVKAKKCLPLKTLQAYGAGIPAKEMQKFKQTAVIPTHEKLAKSTASTRVFTLREPPQPSELVERSAQTYKSMNRSVSSRPEYLRKKYQTKTQNTATQRSSTSKSKTTSGTQATPSKKPAAQQSASPQQAETKLDLDLDNLDLDINLDNDVDLGATSEFKVPMLDMNAVGVENARYSAALDED